MLILLNSVLSVFIFYHLQQSIRNQVSSTKMEIKTLKQLKFAKDDLSKGVVKLFYKKSDEILFQGNLYDIKFKQDKGDTIVFICHLDKKEKDLVKNFNKTQKEESALQKLFHLQHKLISSLYFPVLQIEHKQYFTEAKIFSIHASDILEIFPDIDYPPPELS